MIAASSQESSKASRGTAPLQHGFGQVGKHATSRARRPAPWMSSGEFQEQEPGRRSAKLLRGGERWLMDAAAFAEICWCEDDRVHQGP